jgi:N-(2-amino-2-carboxyethyl)-L-glutamate synthase
MIVTHATDLLFRDVFFEIEGLVDARVVLKLEGFHITGSIKIKTAIGLIADAERAGRIAPGRTTIVESSSGNLGVALSCVCSQKGYDFICVSDPNINAGNIQAIRAFGGRVHIVRDRDANGGFVGSRVAWIENLLRDNSDCFWLNQYANEANPNVHADETAQEILAAFPKPDWLFVGVGTSGTLMGCTRRFRTASPHTRIVAVDPEGSVNFGGVPAPRHIPGIGGSRTPEILDRRAPDMVVSIAEMDTIRTCREIAQRYGLLLGGSSGTAIAAVRLLREKIRRDELVVVICPDLGEKYLDTIYDDGWVREKYPSDVPCEMSTEPGHDQTGNLRPTPRSTAAS